MGKKRPKPKNLGGGGGAARILDELRAEVSSKDPAELDAILNLSYPEGLVRLTENARVRFGQKRVLDALAEALGVTAAYLAKVLRGSGRADEKLRTRTIQQLCLRDTAFPELQAKESPETVKKVYVPKAAPRRQRILVFRNGGFGDILLTTPALRGLREKFPHARITYMCHKPMACVLENNPHVDEVVTCANFWPPFPELDRLAPQFDKVFNLYMAAEGEKYLESWNRVEAFCDAMEVAPSDLSLVLNRKPQEQERDLIGLQLEGSAAERSWPYEYGRELSRLLVEDGFRVVLFSHKKVGWDEPGIINKAGEIDFVEALNVLSTCRLLVGPESSMYHFAAAMDIPFVVIISSLNPQLQLKQYRHKVFDCVYGIMPCPPCFHTPRCGIVPTREDQRGQAACMRAIKPERVHERVLDVIRRTNGSQPSPSTRPAAQSAKQPAPQVSP